MPSPNRWTLAATILASSMTFVDATVVNVALPALQADLHATITEVQWVIEAYALFLGALILVGGSMGDQFGRKRVFLGGLVFFTAASIFCGFVLGLLEWPALGGGHALVLSGLVVGTLSLILFLVVERGVPNPMLPLRLFGSRSFTVANLLTLLLYAALAVIMFLVPMNLI